MLSCVSSLPGKPIFDEKSSTTCICRHWLINHLQYAREIVTSYLLVQPFHAGDPLRLLKGMNLNIILMHNLHKLVIDIVEYLSLHFQGLDNLLLCVLQR